MAGVLSPALFGLLDNPSVLLEGMTLARVGAATLSTAVTGVVRMRLKDRIEEKLPHMMVPVLVVRDSRDPISPQRWGEEATRVPITLDAAEDSLKSSTLRELTFFCMSPSSWEIAMTPSPDAPAATA